MHDALAEHLDLTAAEVGHLVTIGAIPRTGDGDVARHAYIYHMREQAVRRACRVQGIEAVFEDLMGSVSASGPKAA